MANSRQNPTATDAPTTLIAGLGAPRGGYVPTRYSYGDGSDKISTPFAPLATAMAAAAKHALFIDRVVVALTEYAEHTQGEALREACRELELPEPIFVRIQSEISDSTVVELFRALRDALSDSERVVVDITHGYRHLPLLMVAVVRVLAVARSLDIAYVGYGLLEDEQPGWGRIVDLTWLVTLAEWEQAASALAQGDGRPLASQLDKVAWSHKSGKRRQPIRGAANDLRHVTNNLRAALPLELALLDDVGAGLMKAEPLLEASLPVASDLLRSVAAELSALTGLERIGKQQDKKLVLSPALLEQQSAVVDRLLETGDLAGASRVAREYVVNQLLLNDGQVGYQSGWLRREVRLLAEAALRWNANVQGKPVQSLLDVMREIRNALAHAGHSHERIDIKKTLETFRKAWRAVRDLPPETWRWPGRAGTGGVAVVTPLGLARGVLHTLLTRLTDVANSTSPEAEERTAVSHVVVVTSEAGVPGAREAYERARAAVPFGLPADLDIHQLADPHTDFGPSSAEDDEVVKRYEQLLDTGLVVVNMVGGTTAMQMRVRRLEAKLRQCGVPVLVVATVDARAAADQRADPYGGGELVCVGGDATGQ